MRVEALLLLPSDMVLLVGQAWLADGATVTPDHEHDEFAWWPAEPGEWPGEAHDALHRRRRAGVRLMGRNAFTRIVTFGRLEVVSFIHSTVYLSLLVCAFALGNPEPATFILGMAHGLIWIGMSLVCIAAAQVSRDPVLAGRHRRRARRTGAVRGDDRVRGRKPPA